MLRAPKARIRSRLSAALLVVILAAAALPRGARAQELRYTRPLEVPAVGWVRVPLPPEVLRRTGAGGGLQVFGPDGDALAYVRRPGGARPTRRPAEPLAPERTEGGWWLRFEVAPGSRPHDLLVVTPEAPDAAGRPASVRLEGSADGESWHLLAAGALAEDGGQLTLAYPATDLRRLRLAWPRGADGETPPRLAEATVEEVAPGAFRLSLSRPDCRASEEGAGARRTVCRLPLAGTGRFLRRLCFTVTAKGAAAYRLYVPRQGRWEPVAEAAWSGSPEEAPRCARLDVELAGAPEPLRLELFGAGTEAPGARDAAAGFAPEALLFEARRPGVHALAYGPGVFPGAGAGGAGGSVEPPSGVEPALVAPGAEEASEVPASALALPTAAGPAPAVRFAERWDLAADAPQPGALYRLTLPSAVYRAAAPDLADLRLIVPEGGSRLQVPYVRWRPEEPVLVDQRRGADPELAPEGGGTSRVAIAAPEPGLPLSVLSVSAVPVDGTAPWERRIRAREPRAEGGAEGPAGAWVDWDCVPRPPLPCRVSVPLEGSAPGPWVVEIDDGGAAPLPAVDLELWRRSDVLLFPWPADDATPVLAAGAEGLEVPEFELSGRRDELVARPWREAKLVLEGRVGARLGAVAITLALIGAAVALLVLLDRILAEQAPGRR
jgi:hypothetical protein